MTKMALQEESTSRPMVGEFTLTFYPHHTFYIMTRCARYTLLDNTDKCHWCVDNWGDAGYCVPGRTPIMNDDGDKIVGLHSNPAARGESFVVRLRFERL